MFSKILNYVLIACFSTSLIYNPTYAEAGTVLGLPEPGAMVNLSQAYSPAMIKGLTVHKDNPFLFDFIVDVGEDRLSGEPLKQEGDKLIKYFLASLAIPEKDFWVNLSPYEKDKIVPDALGQTDLGRDLLAQDYILKQITASLIYPEKQLGKSFWDRVYAKAQAQFGTTEIPVNTFNKVWITADRAEVFEHNQTAFVVDSHLKVMLESDYLAQEKNKALTGSAGALTPTGPVPAAPSQSSGLEKLAPPVDRAPAYGPPVASATSSNVASQIIKEIILPELEKEINTGKNFANLRQIFNSIILSSWYKKNLKQALLNQVYADQSKVKGIDLEDPTVKQKIYDQYLKAYKKGVFNYIKEDVTKSSTLPKKYFSGGIVRAGVAENPTVTTNSAMLTPILRKRPTLVLIAVGAIVTAGVLGTAELSTALDKLFPLKPSSTSPQKTLLIQNTNSNQAMTAERSLQRWIDSTTFTYQRALQRFLQEPHNPNLIPLIYDTRRNYAHALFYLNKNDILTSLLIFDTHVAHLKTDATASLIAQERIKIAAYLRSLPSSKDDEAMIVDPDPADFANGTGLTQRLRNILIGMRATNIIRELESAFQARKRYETNPKEELDINLKAIALAINAEYKLDIRPYFDAQDKFLGFDLIRYDVWPRQVAPVTPYKAKILERSKTPPLPISEALMFSLFPFSGDFAMSTAWSRRDIHRIQVVNTRLHHFHFPLGDGSPAAIFQYITPETKNNPAIVYLRPQKKNLPVDQGKSLYFYVVFNIFNSLPETYRPSIAQLYEYLLSFYPLDNTENARNMIDDLRIEAQKTAGSNPEFSTWATAIIDHHVALAATPKTAGVNQDPATASIDSTHHTFPGGIDLNTSSGMTWSVRKDGQGVEMSVDPAMVEQIRREGITSLTPVIFKITPITNIWPLIGLKEPQPHEQLA